VSRQSAPRRRDRSRRRPRRVSRHRARSGGAITTLSGRRDPWPSPWGHPAPATGSEPGGMVRSRGDARARGAAGGDAGGAAWSPEGPRAGPPRVSASRGGASVKTRRTYVREARFGRGRKRPLRPGARGHARVGHAHKRSDDETSSFARMRSRTASANSLAPQCPPKSEVFLSLAVASSAAS